MIRTDIGDQRHLRTRHGDPPAQNAPARGLDDGRARRALAYDPPRTRGTGIVAAGECLRAEKHSIGAAVSCRPPAARLGTGGDEAHGSGLAIRARHERQRDVTQFPPRHFRHLRKRRQRKVLSAGSCPECQHLVIQHVREAARRSRIEECAQPRLRLARGEALEARQCRALLEHRWNEAGDIARILECLCRELGLEPLPARSIERRQGRAQRPLVDLRRREERIDRGCERERSAARVHPGCESPLRNSRGVRPIPPEVCACPRRTYAPGIEQGIVHRDAGRFQLRTGPGKEQVGAGQAP